MKQLISLFGLLVLLSACAAGSREQTVQKGGTELSSEQIFQAVSGNTLRLESIDFDAQVHFLDNGRMSARSIRNTKDTGKWDINSDQQLCLKFDTWYYSDERCFTMVQTGTKQYALFTSNGARAYSAAGSDGDPEKLAPAGRKKEKTYLREKMAASQRAGKESSAAPENLSENAEKPRVIPSPPPPPEEIRHTLATMAKNCPNCNFAGADLKGVDLVTANLAGANLAGADLSGANLRRANLAGANLAGAIMANTNLAGANLANCNMSEADLTGANLVKANLTGAMTEGVILRNASLEGVIGLEKRK